MFTIGFVILQILNWFPLSISKFISLFCFFSILHPVLICLIDVCYHHYNCSDESAFRQTYFNEYFYRESICFEGDFAKLSNHFSRTEGVGITGGLITVLVYLTVMCISTYILYDYIVLVFQQSKLLDIWIRINALDYNKDYIERNTYHNVHNSDLYTINVTKTETNSIIPSFLPYSSLYIPYDNEVSMEELVSIAVNSQTWKGSDGSVIRLHVSVSNDMNDVGEDIISIDNSQLLLDKQIHIYNVYTLYVYKPVSPLPPSAMIISNIIEFKNFPRKNTKQIYRQFKMLSNGRIIEIFYHPLKIDL